MMRKKSREGSIPVKIMVVLILLAALTLSSGCINKLMQKSSDSAQAGDSVPQDTPGMNATSSPAGAQPSALQQMPGAQMTPAKSDVVTEVAPYLTPDPYPILHGTRINDTPIENPLDRTPEFEKTYTLEGNATGLQVNVAEGPLYIVYQVTPKYDCMVSPDSCRGNLAASVNRPYMTITVRDNQTKEVVAQDGYAREYSSDTGRYEITISSIDETTGEPVTTTASPGPRYIKIYKEGVYHITIEGAYLDVNVKILTGASPSRLDVGNGDTSSSAPTPGETPPDDGF